MLYKSRKLYKLPQVFLVLLAFSPFYCYSEEIFESTPNLTAQGLSWNLALPPGHTVNGIAYRYSVEKNAEDSFFVNIDQQHSEGTMRFTDNWSGLPGNSITRAFPLFLQEVTEGRLSTEGFGTVRDPVVIYTYQYEPEIEMPDMASVDVYDVVLDTPEMRKDDEEERDRQRMMQQKKERARNAAASALVTAQAAIAAAQFFALDSVPTTYYAALPGGQYEDAVISGGNVPDNKSGARVGLAQQLLHEKMVEAQYEEK